MADLIFIRGSHGLMPSDESSEAYFKKLKVGKLVRVKAFTMRNPKFHRKFFAMMNVAYENWDHPTIDTPYGPAVCPIGQFRNDVICIAGFGELIANTKGEWRYRAKSIKFHSMDDEEFEQLYKACLNVILTKFLARWSNEDMERAVNAMMGFESNNV